MQSKDEAGFELQLQGALERIRTILDNTRNPQLPTEVQHKYDDKYLLADYLTKVSIASLLQCLESAGVTAQLLPTLRGWAKTQSVTFRLRAQEDCKYLREETRRIDSAHEFVTEHESGGSRSKKTEKVVTKVTEHFWGFDFKYELVAFAGTSADQAVVIRARAGYVEIKTAAKTTPRPKTVVRPNLDVNLGWLLGRVDADGHVAFTIDRTDEECHTPRRNEQVDEALEELERLHAWCGAVWSYFARDLFPAQQEHGLDLSAITAAPVFVPVVPLFEERKDGVLPVDTMNPFLAEERRSLAEKCLALAKVFPQQSPTIITSAEAVLLVTLLHAQHVCQAFEHGIDFIEEMLRSQLIAAIGKELGPKDFTAYMAFHHRKLFKPEFQPQPFSYAVRRPDHYPEGILAIEGQTAGESMPDPLATTVVHRPASRPMTFALDASARVSFLGDRYLHAFVLHQFSGRSDLAVSLVARARQFSSFILLVGRIASADVFEPKFGIVLQNKDLLRIPLMLEQIPTPKEFRDAISSLSPEQQRFAKAFRGMQLESTLFGVCVIQVKPQLEKLLKLPADSLTKEIKLTEDLLGLFIEHQIPSDLLSYDGPPEAAPQEKLERVRTYVGRIQEMLARSKQRELEEAQQKEAFRLAEMNRSVRPQFPPGAMPMGKAAFSPPAPCASAGPSFEGEAICDERSLSCDDAMPEMECGAEPVPMPEPAAEAPPETGGSPAPKHGAAEADASPVEGDYTRIPAALDKKFEELDVDSALRPTIIKPGDVWSKDYQKALLAPPASAVLGGEEQKKEKNKAFDLLDALTKSGALPVDQASLHVVMAATHCFDQTLIDTVIQGNVNPIEKVERSVMIVATTLFDRPAAELINESQKERFFTTSPGLKLLPAGKDGAPRG